MDDEMLLKTRQIIVTLTLDCFRCVSLYSDHLHFIWIAFLALIDKPTFVPPPVYKTFWRSDVLMQFSMLYSTPTIRLARLAAGLVHESYDFAIMMTSQWKVFWRMKYWRIALKAAYPPK